MKYTEDIDKCADILAEMGDDLFAQDVDVIDEVPIGFLPGIDNVQPIDPESVSPETAYAVMLLLMKKFKEFSTVCELAWKIQEIPAPIRQRLISLDQSNQDKYQKMFLMIKRHAQEMVATTVENLPEGLRPKK